MLDRFPIIDDSRITRYKNQIAFEDSIESLYGKSVDARLDDIRNALFKEFAAEHGINPTDIRNASTITAISFDSDIPLSIVKDVQIPIPSEVDLPDMIAGYNEQIDDLYNLARSTQDPQLKEELAYKLAATADTLGILIHKYPDGNGQTYRCLAFSYLKELVPDKFQDRHLPLRLDTSEQSQLAGVNLNNFFIDEQNFVEHKLFTEAEGPLVNLVEHGNVGNPLNIIKSLVTLKKLMPKIPLQDIIRNFPEIQQKFKSRVRKNPLIDIELLMHTQNIALGAQYLDKDTINRILAKFPTYLSPNEKDFFTEVSALGFNLEAPDIDQQLDALINQIDSDIVQLKVELFNRRKITLTGFLNMVNQYKLVNKVIVNNDLSTSAPYAKRLQQLVNDSVAIFKSDNFFPKRKPVL